MNRKYRKTVIAGNWKMNMLASEIKPFMEELRAAMPAPRACDVVLCTPAVMIPTMVKAGKEAKVAAGGQDVSKFDTFAEYKADVEKRLQEANDRRANAENENALIEAVTAGSTVEIPQCMIDSQIDYLVRDMEYRLMYMYQGMKLEDYLKYTGSSMEELRKSKTEEAKRDVKIRLVLEAIVKAENLDVTDAELDAELARIAESAGKSVEEYRKGVDERQLSYIKNDLLMKKLVEFLKANNTFEVKKAEKKTAAKKTTAAKEAENGEEKAAAPKKTAAKKSTAKKTTEENK